MLPGHLVSCSSSPPAARTVRTQSTGGFYRPDRSPCTYTPSLCTNRRPTKRFARPQGSTFIDKEPNIAGTFRFLHRCFMNLNQTIQLTNGTCLNLLAISVTYCGESTCNFPLFSPPKSFELASKSRRDSLSSNLRAIFGHILSMYRTNKFESGLWVQWESFTVVLLRFSLDMIPITELPMRSTGGSYRPERSSCTGLGLKGAS